MLKRAEFAKASGQFATLISSVFITALISFSGPAFAESAARSPCEAQKSKDAQIETQMMCFFYHLGIVEAAFSSGYAGGEKICGYYNKDPVEVAANLTKISGEGYTETFAGEANGLLRFMFQCKE